MSEVGLTPEILKYLSLSLSPVIIIGIGAIIILLSRKKNKTNDKGSGNQL